MQPRRPDEIKAIVQKVLARHPDWDEVDILRDLEELDGLSSVNFSGADPSKPDPDPEATKTRNTRIRELTNKLFAS